VRPPIPQDPRPGIVKCFYISAKHMQFTTMTCLHAKLYCNVDAVVTKSTTDEQNPTLVVAPLQILSQWSKKTT